MPRPVYRQRWAWIDGMRTSPDEVIPDVECAGYSLSTLADLGLLTTRTLADFQDETGLADLAWTVSWNQSALADAGGNLRNLMRRTQGFVIFMHGWCASGGAWQHLPALTCAGNQRLVALTPDLNGFGSSPFLADVPALELCDPLAMMESVKLWVDMLGLRSSGRARRRRKVITFVGHSMGGAALFYFESNGWYEHEYARCAVAPALLLDDDLEKRFYQAAGVLPLANQPIDELKSRMTRRIVDNILASADEATHAEHLRIFETTPKGTLVQTLYALGSTSLGLPLKRRPNFRVILAHDDRLVNVTHMLSLLDSLGFAAHQIQVVAGDHFLFSASDDDRRSHWRNRELVLGEVLYLHEACRESQRT